MSVRDEDAREADRRRAEVDREPIRRLAGTVRNRFVADPNHLKEAHHG
jgi:hypothetical protein